MSRPRFDVYQDKKEQWRWRLLASNGRIIADSGEAYTSRSNVMRAIKSVRSTAPKAVIPTTQKQRVKNGKALKLRPLTDSSSFASPQGENFNRLPN